MREYKFIQENTNYYRLKVLLVTLLIFFVGVAIIIAFVEPLYELAKQTSLVQSIKSLTSLEFSTLTPGGMLYTGFLGGLFFILLPLEFLFYGSIIKGSDPLLTLFMMVTGFILAQVVNYFLGSRLNPIFMHLVSKKKVYAIRRFINKYGAYGVLLANASPLSSEILTFALGITRYNVYRLFTLAFIGTLIKYAIIMCIALFFR